MVLLTATCDRMLCFNHIGRLIHVLFFKQYREKQTNQRKKRKNLICSRLSQGCGNLHGPLSSAHLTNMNVITHPWESENGFVGMGSTISRTRLGGHGGRLSPFHYTQASTVMKAILIGFNACGGARSCFLMALTKEYESVIIKSHSPAVLRSHWSSFTIPPFWMGY